jgi:hypothetical protein
VWDNLSKKYRSLNKTVRHAPGKIGLKSESTKIGRRQIHKQEKYKDVYFIPSFFLGMCESPFLTLIQQWT